MISPARPITLPLVGKNVDLENTNGHDVITMMDSELEKHCILSDPKTVNYAIIVMINLKQLAYTLEEHIGAGGRSHTVGFCY